MKMHTLKMTFFDHHLSLWPSQEAWKAIPTWNLFLHIRRWLFPPFWILRLFQSDHQVLVCLIGLDCQPQSPHPEHIVVANQLEFFFSETLPAKSFVIMPCSNYTRPIIIFKRSKSANADRSAWRTSQENINLSPLVLVVPTIHTSGCFSDHRPSRPRCR